MCVPKEQDERTMTPLGTPDAWEPFSPVGRHVCREPLAGPSANPLRRDPTPGTEGKHVPLEVLEEPDEAMAGEPHGRCRLLAEWAGTQQLRTLESGRRLRPH